MSFRIALGDNRLMPADVLLRFEKSENSDVDKVGDLTFSKVNDVFHRCDVNIILPMWHEGKADEGSMLYSCYKKAMEFAKQKRYGSISLPIADYKTFGYPKETAFKAAMDAIKDFLEHNDLQVTLVLFDMSYTARYDSLLKDIDQYIKQSQQSTDVKDSDADCVVKLIEETDDSKRKNIACNKVFDAEIMRVIRERGISKEQICRKANVSIRFVAHTIKSKSYKTEKQQIVAFAVALELSVDETRSLLEKFGFTLSEALEFDLIIRYFLDKQKYDIYEINTVLFRRYLTQLGE